MSTAIAADEKTSLSQLDQIRKFTKIVADTADFESIKDYKPEDATTNPSLVYAATQKEQYGRLLDEVLQKRKKSGLSGREQIEDICDHLLVQFGSDILQIVPGRVSTETDARLSYDVEGSINKARRLIQLYEEKKIPRERVLIKIASTWEGLLAAEQLQKEGIRCNLTLMFSLVQAVRAAEAKVQLISPFVGRIYDWYKAHEKRDYKGPEDPGVQSVTEIYSYYKKFGIPTEVMGASFRNTGQIVELAGCDCLTISPELMDELAKSKQPLERKLEPEKAKSEQIERLNLDEKSFRWMLNDNAMAYEKTGEGIRKFAADVVKLEKFVATKLQAALTVGAAAMFNVVLVEPEIPPNTGNIGRLCLASQSKLHLVRPLGFSTDDRSLKRAGLDYWNEVDVRYWDSLGELQGTQPPGARYFYLTTKTDRPYYNAQFHSNDFLVFGRETKGLPESLLAGNMQDLLTIPMHGTRSLNLATAVAIVLFEALRQTSVQH